MAFMPVSEFLRSWKRISRHSPNPAGPSAFALLWGETTIFLEPLFVNRANALSRLSRRSGSAVSTPFGQGTCIAHLGGIAVHIGARVMGEAGPGEVLCSRTVRDLVVGSGLSFEDRGSRTLKGVPEEWQLFAVSA